MADLFKKASGHFARLQPFRLTTRQSDDPERAVSVMSGGAFVLGHHRRKYPSFPENSQFLKFRPSISGMPAFSMASVPRGRWHSFFRALRLHKFHNRHFVGCATPHNSTNPFRGCANVCVSRVRHSRHMSSSPSRCSYPYRPAAPVSCSSARSKAAFFAFSMFSCFFEVTGWRRLNSS